MTYFLTTKTKRTNASKTRHIVSKSSNLQELKNLFSFINKEYIVEVYNGKWELIETR